MFWRDLGERVAATVLQVMISALALSGMTGTDWAGTMALAASAGLLAVLKGLLARLVGDPDTASLVRTPPT